MLPLSPTKRGSKCKVTYVLGVMYDWACLITVCFSDAGHRHCCRYSACGWSWSGAGWHCRQCCTGRLVTSTYFPILLHRIAKPETETWIWSCLHLKPRFSKKLPGFGIPILYTWTVCGIVSLSSSGRFQEHTVPFQSLRVSSLLLSYQKWHSLHFIITIAAFRYISSQHVQST